MADKPKTELFQAEVMGTEEEFPSGCKEQLDFLIAALQYATTAAQNLVGIIYEPETLKVNCEEAENGETNDVSGDSK